jgi:RHS repeat-associated protein
MGGATYYLSYDQVGSLRLVADASGNVVKRISYDSFGNILEDTNPSFKIPFGFAGGLHDRDTGLVRFGFRDYDPEVGRWTAKDPIGFAGGDADLYGYVLNNPANFADPNGQLFIQAAGAAIGLGINAYKNYSAFKSGKISGGEYILSIGLGALTGIASTFGGGLLAGAL